jgi:hypothetical protein
LRPTQKRALEENPPERALRKTDSENFRELKKLDELVAEAGRDRNLVAALGAAAAQHGSAGLGGHAAQKAVDLAPAAAIRLKGALRHRRILFSNLWDRCIAARIAPPSEGLYARMCKRVWQQLLSIPKFRRVSNSNADVCFIFCTIRVSNFCPILKSSPTLVQTVSLSRI